MLHVGKKGKLKSVKGNKKVSSGKITDIAKSIPELSKILDSIPIMMMITDGNACVEHINFEMSKFTETSMKKAANMMCGELIMCSQDFRAKNGCGTGELCKGCKIRSAIEFTYKTGKPVFKAEASYEIKNQDKKQETILLVSTARIKTKAGNKVLMALDDISAKKKAEIELISSMADLERSNKELEQFASVASHDLKEPLRMIASYIELLNMRYGKSMQPEAREFMGFAVAGAKKMDNLIQGILEYSMVGKKKEKNKQLDTNDIIRRIKEDLKIEKSDCSVSAEELPKLIANETEIYQLFRNLIGNSLKFRSEKLSEVRIYARSISGAYEFTVEDNGIGIQQQYREKVFRLFERLNNDEKYPGTGIGLTICKKIVEGLGGKIWIENSKTGGAAVKFTIPRNK